MKRLAVVAGLLVGLPMTARSDLSIQYEDNRYYIEYSTGKQQGFTPVKWNYLHD